MGDMADLELEQVEHYEERRLAYHLGQISDADAFDEGVIDELGYEYIPSRQNSQTCYCCKQTGLHWKPYHGKWRLFDNDGIHKCPVKPLKTAQV